MKKYLLVIIMAIFALCASAQGASPTKQEIEEQCSILQDNINLLRSKLVDIKTAEQNKVLEMKGEVSNDLLASNDSLIDKATRIVKKAKSCYEQGDTTSNNVPLVLGTVSEGLKAYVSVIFKTPNDIKNIEVKKDFEKIIKDQLAKFDNALHMLENSDDEVDDSNSTVSGTGIHEEDKSLDLSMILELIGFAVILCIIGIVSLLMKSNYSKSQRDIHRLKEELEEKIRNNKDDISDLSARLKSYRGNTEYNAIHGGLSEKQIREMILSEIDKCQKSIEHNYDRKSMQNQLDNSVPIHGEKGQVEASGVKKQNDYSLYGQLQNDGSFKVSMSDSRNAFYVLKLKDSKAEQAEFFLKEFDNETAKAIIEGRQMHLVPACDIESSASPQKIILMKPGMAEKQGNSWFVKSKAQIRLVNA
jgi:hypothetical protein